MEKWYENDWVICAITSICMAVGVLLNYYYNGGHLVW